MTEMPCTALARGIEGMLDPTSLEIPDDYDMEVDE